MTSGHLPRARAAARRIAPAVALAVALALALSACDGGGGRYRLPDAPAQLSPGNAGGADEDPTVLVAQDGKLYVAWFSDRSGNPDLWLIHSKNGKGWSDPIRVTDHAWSDFYPTLIQDAAGTFHLTWFRVTPAPDFFFHVWHNRSADGVTWDTASEVQVTDGVVADFVPRIVEETPGTLAVYFSSQQRNGFNTRDIYVVRSTDGGDSWSAPANVSAVNHVTVMDDFPYVGPIVGGGLAMVWSRYDDDGMAWNVTPTSDILYSTSADGTDWAAPTAITDDDAVPNADVIPSLYLSGKGDETFVTWTSTGPSGDSRGDIVDLPLADAAAYPTGVALRTDAADVADYSGLIVPVNRRRYLLVWTTDRGGTAKIYYQGFRR